MRRLQRVFPALILPAIAVVAFGAGAPRPNSTPAGNAGINVVSFREEIEPYFKAHCTTCHSAATKTSGFNLESTDTLFAGGTKFGAKVVVAGKPLDSLLVRYVAGKQQPRMPLGGEPISDKMLSRLSLWIAQGAKIDAVKLGWPYLPPRIAAVPKVKQTAWCRNPIDNFVLAKLEAKHLAPAPPTSKIALLRRVYADLVGVPPSPNEAAQFVSDASPNAYEKVVDRLLADPRYGERWARHWLDLVRYAETNGFENDEPRPRAWRFRDYVIRAFNGDKPYNRFLQEQIAGDELFPNDADALVATGYIRLGTWDELSTDPPQRWQDTLNDVTDTTGSVMLGMTVGCARCHNHKYDRITQADYYRMQAFFTPVEWTDIPLPGDTHDPSFVKLRAQEAETHLKPLREQINALKEQARAYLLAEKQAKAKLQSGKADAEKIAVSDEDVENYLRSHKALKREQIENDIRHWENELRPCEPTAEAVTDGRDTPRVTHLLQRGNLLTPGPEVKPGFVAALNGNSDAPASIVPPVGNKTTGRRAALARWIASDANPMTARVLVNRLWQHHFGRGIVNTPSDFGRNGDKPSHPELLDWLAARFVREGWSLKKMHRLMLLSNTYRQSTESAPAMQNLALKADPLNALLSHMNRLRMEGEALRDSILTVSGRLNAKRGGPGIYPHVSDEVLSSGSTHKWGASPDEEGLRRTIYVFQRRSLMLPLVEAFDGADMSNTCPRRATTTIAPQSLALFNGEFSRGEARWFAARVAKQAGDDVPKQIAAAYQIALLRSPTVSQQTLALDFIQKQTQIHLRDKSDSAKETQTSAKARQAALADFCHVLINTNEFLYLD